MFRRLFAQMWGFLFSMFTIYEDSVEDEMESYCKEIRNVYAGKRGICNCRTRHGIRCIGYSCIFRNQSISCLQKCGPGCMNRMFDGEWGIKDLQLLPRDGFGTCTVTKVLIPEDTKIIEYVGKVVFGRPQSNQLFCHPITRDDSSVTDVKMKDCYVDALKRGNLSRCIKHSMDPNCEVQPWIIGHRIHLIVVSLRTIEFDEVLTITYPHFSAPEKRSKKKPHAEATSTLTNYLTGYLGERPWTSQVPPASASTSSEKPSSSTRGNAAAGGDNPPKITPVLTAEQRQFIDDKLKKTKTGNRVVKIVLGTEDIDLYKNDFSSLSGNGWLTDNALDAYLGLLALRSHNSALPSVYAFQTYFWIKLEQEGYNKTMKNWRKNDNIFDNQIILFPIHVNKNHWTLVSFDMRKKTLLYYDSLGHENQKCLETIWEYVHGEMQRLKNVHLDITEWKVGLFKNEATQNNSDDCGIYVCETAKQITRDVIPEVRQSDVPTIRETMMYELLVQTFL